MTAPKSSASPDLSAPATHTPGPWSVRDGEHGHPEAIVVDRFDLAVCLMQEWDDPSWQQANARLIAAAPDLLAFFRQLAAMAGPSDEDGVIAPAAPYSWESVARLAFDYAHAAIRKAEGKAEAVR